MKNLILTSFITLGNLASYAQSVAINTDVSLPNASAILDIKSITKVSKPWQPLLAIMKHPIFPENMM